MRYFVFKLKFLTPVHFGDAQNGGDLDKVGESCRADTFFSAICNELASMGSEDGLAKFIGAVRDDKLVISDLMPYYDDGDICNLYLPKPVLDIHPRNELHSLQQVREDATRRKKQKKTAFMRASSLKTYLTNLKAGKIALDVLPHLGELFLVPKVNCREELPLPYVIGAYRFADIAAAKKQAGLYFIAGLADDLDADKLEQLVKSLGFTGIGGKRSSGFGKFELAEEKLELDELGIYEDDAAIYAMLSETKAARYMNLAAFVPKQEELGIVKDGTYKLIRRSGFIYSAAFTEARKHDTVAMVEAGSCFKQRLNGQLLQLSVKDCPHAVYKYGKGLFVGLPL